MTHEGILADRRGYHSVSDCNNRLRENSFKFLIALIIQIPTIYASKKRPPTLKNA